MNVIENDNEGVVAKELHQTFREYIGEKGSGGVANDNWNNLPISVKVSFIDKARRHLKNNLSVGEQGLNWEQLFEVNPQNDG